MVHSHEERKKTWKYCRTCFRNSAKRHSASCSLRLNDILAEQPGLYITNSFGFGVQMQGLNPTCTLVLIDGEPLIGSNGGVLDLSRIAVGNIKKIEVVKGLYQVYTSGPGSGDAFVQTGTTFSRL